MARKLTTRYTFAGCYLAGLKWARRRWKLVFIEPRFWDGGVFRQCECGRRQ